MILILLLVSIIIYLLFARLSLFIDTSTNRYFIKLLGICSINAERDETEILILRMHIFFMDFNFYPLRPDEKKKRKQEKKKGKSRFSLTIKQAYRLIKSFKVKRLYLDLDTGDCITNAKLYPVFALLNYRKGNFNLNFNGRNKLVLHIQNRPINIIKSYINF
ncbi:MAG: hypothetical protein KUG68_06335 [Flavobacteriaceae bacterium]|nr:hypothetical protein [Flavobacteriaceae bacterium]